MRSILSVGRTCCWLGEATTSAVIVDASAYYAAFYRAASVAQDYILLAGWQFDSSVKLLRGEAARSAAYPVEFLAFLNALCRERPRLRVYILAWDYSIIYSLEREWLQGLKFAFQSSDAIRFEFDAHPSFGGSHHQKLVVIDGVTAFVGGLDICDERWDDRSHTAQHELRINASGVPCRPNHDVQSAVQGEVAAALTRLFCERWYGALGERLELRPNPDSPAAGLSLTVIDNSAILPLRAERVAIARTLPDEGQAGVREIQTAVGEALAAAEQLVYIETQYFTSRSATALFLQRLRDSSKPRLQIIALMPRGADNSKEKFALGDVQSAMLSELAQAAETHGHDLRFLCSAVEGGDCEAATFIHSKVLIVDDQLLCVGSANMTERSLSLDSELCLLWQGEPASELSHDIKRVRASLLAEHSGRPLQEFLEIAGLVRKLDAWVDDRSSRLRVCHFDPAPISPVKLAIFDPGGPPTG